MEAVLCKHATCEACEIHHRSMAIHIFHELPIYKTWFPCYARTPTVGLEPTTIRLRALRSADWARRAWWIWKKWISTSEHANRFHLEHVAMDPLHSQPRIVVNAAACTTCDTHLSFLKSKKTSVSCWEVQCACKLLRILTVHQQIFFIIASKQWCCFRQDRTEQGNQKGAST